MSPPKLPGRRRPAEEGFCAHEEALDGFRHLIAIGCGGSGPRRGVQTDGVLVQRWVASAGPGRSPGSFF
eukprot:scaffold67435_cov100-Phaeocystis_antarctica.AAC.4